ncbi:hypothetical protein KC19_6G046500 [Ceratodon purpureus]|uniref:ADP-ribosylation factor n=1 Tax=Ceratodon purpureus TaxID=3225 RepID=A0A8T0HBJ8_CERPU|nr:hypothetical protein KC19_6G046500 [Ceratodon purpureus]
MGQVLAKLFNRFGRYKNHQKLLMLGLDGAGKTTLLRKVKVLEPRTQPTVGFNLESLQYRQLTLVMWDVGGQEKIRALWHHYFVKSHGLIFVVDSSDPGRIPEARKELQKLLHEPELKEAKLLVYANKQDVNNCLSVSDLTDMLDLSLIEDREWYVQGCSASTGKGVYEGLDWLVDALKPS